MYLELEIRVVCKEFLALKYAVKYVSIIRKKSDDYL